MKTRELVAVTSLALALGPAASAFAQTPPRDLHLVGDHWTAWDPPTELPEGAEVHIIERGDTLWDLARRFYGDPYLWPQLWERNQYIRDAHWIYPGDPLVLSVEVVPLEDLGEIDLGGEAEEQVAEEPGLTLDSRARPPRPLGGEDDIYCSGYIGPLEQSFGYRITGSEYQALSPILRLQGGETAGRGAGEGIYGDVDTVKFDLTFGDIVYLDGGRAAGLAPGTVYTVVEPGQQVRHPLDEVVVGRHYAYRGRVRVLTVLEDQAIGEIVHACGAIHVGSGLQPFVPEPVPLGRRSGLRPPNFPSSAESLAEAPLILLAKDGIVSLGEDHVVYIDRGVGDGVAPGDIYTVYRMNEPGFPPVVLGELAVLTVHETSAVARIIESRYPMYVGDRLEPKLAP
jgi:hypothetical protein